MIGRRIAQVKGAFFTPLQEAERVGVEPTIRVSIERYQFVGFFRQGAICASQRSTERSRRSQRFAIAQVIMGIPHKLAKLFHLELYPFELQLH
jgi:hypothetical protein